MPLQFGVDVLLKQDPTWKHERIAFLTNDAAKTKNGILSRKALKDADFNIIKLFSPEHGMKANGVDGAFMDDAIDEITGLPIISLYGNKFIPTEEDLNDIDILVFDIPDAGTRFYTYLWSMTYWMEASKISNKKIIILDRPNPLGGNLSMCEGPMLNEKLTSFIGRFNIPIKHQCTFGELAQYFNHIQHWNIDLKIIQCEGLDREKLFYDWLINWVNPSPALQNIESCILYPGLCFFEATNVSVGRGSNYSFEWIGAEWFNLPAINMIAQTILGDDLKTENLKLALTINKVVKEINGIRIKVIDPYNYDAVLNGLLLLKLIKDLHPDHFKWMPYPTVVNPTGENHLSLLLGIENAEALFDLPLQEWLKQIIVLLRTNEWRSQIEPFLIYH
jgi:uncharacterized protein YbbC (DUF1343 family)